MKFAFNDGRADAKTNNIIICMKSVCVLNVLKLIKSEHWKYQFSFRWWFAVCGGEIVCLSSVWMRHHLFALSSANWNCNSLCSIEHQFFAVGFDFQLSVVSENWLFFSTMLKSFSFIYLPFSFHLGASTQKNNFLPFWHFVCVVF